MNRTMVAIKIAIVTFRFIDSGRRPRTKAISHSRELYVIPASWLPSNWHQASTVYTQPTDTQCCGKINNISHLKLTNNEKKYNHINNKMLPCLAPGRLEEEKEVTYDCCHTRCSTFPIAWQRDPPLSHRTISQMDATKERPVTKQKKPKRKQVLLIYKISRQ